MKFSMVKVANSFQQELHTVRSELSHLDLGTDIDEDENTVSVKFTDPVFHIRSPGDLSPEELNEICSYLCRKMKEHEQRQLEKLYLMHAVLCSESQRQSNQENSVDDDEIMSSSDGEDIEEVEEIPSLRTVTQQYFSNEGLDRAYLEKNNIPVLPIVEKISSQRKKKIENDILSLVASQRQHKFTGRTVARIFHGIQSPCFTALWGYKNTYWRSHLEIDFNTLCEIGTKKLKDLC